MDHADWDDKMRRRAKEQAETRVRVGFFGQPGVGKSSLINVLTGQDIAKVRVGNDVTFSGKSYESNGLSRVDLPGYGTAQFPIGTHSEQLDVLVIDKCHELALALLDKRVDAEAAMA